MRAVEDVGDGFGFDLARVAELAKMPATERIDKLRSIADAIFAAANVASFIVARDKTSLIDLVLEDERNFTDARFELANAVNNARQLLDVLTSAERQLAAALIAIEPSGSSHKAFL